MVDRHPCERILVVDPDPDLRGAIRSVLEEAGCTVAAAADPAQATDRLGVFTPNAVLLDVGLDATDALGFIALLRQDARTERVPVAVMSGSPATLRKIAPRASRALEKPFDLDTLFDTLADLCKEAAA